MDTPIKLRFPPGHFYSPIVNPKEVTEYVENSVRSKTLVGIPGIQLDPLTMIKFWAEHVENVPPQNLPKEKHPQSRYFSRNNSYGLGDALVLHAFLRAARPRRIIEIGSGFSTACMLDASDVYDITPLEITCIEPYPDRLKNLLRPNDFDRVTILEQNVQRCPLNLFEQLGDNDLLFIDSTHVLKTGSDVHFELTQILPVLGPGVLVHFHDIQFPFEYPKGWVFDENFSWNEIYAVHLFLMYNDKFRIEFFTNYFGKQHNALVARTFPDLARFPESLGGSLWVRKC